MADSNRIDETIPSPVRTRVAYGDSQLPFKTLAGALRSTNAIPSDLREGTRLGRFKVSGRIGTGAFSSVYRGAHVYLGYQVALKTPRSDSRIEREMFLREARALALLAHPHVVQVFDADVADGIPFIALELLAGDDLSKVLAAHPCLSVERALDLLEELGAVLVRQEERGILHLDIKPSNIFQRTDGSYCLFDYGIIDVIPDLKRAPASGEPGTLAAEVFGTPAYMAPEQVQGKADHRSDLFALGVVAWECLAGSRARSGSGDLKGIVGTAIPRLKSIREEIPTELDTMIAQLLAVSPVDRYQTARDMVEDLTDFRYGGRVPAGGVVGTAFLAMPFAETFKGVYLAVDDACRMTRLRARRLDHEYFFQDIWSQCVQEIAASRVVIADFTSTRGHGEPNANVVTEAAHARALGKALILITQDEPDKLPFDWRSMPIIRYEGSDEGVQRLREALVVRLRKLVISSLRLPNQP